jgi:hypothetical protein
MAEVNMGNSMRNRECGWVRARLPLWTDQGVATAQSPVVGEGRDVSATDSAAIMQHLAACAICRQQHLELERAMGALAVAAAHLPVVPEAPSLWPEIERRIANLYPSDRARGPHTRDGGDVGALRPWSELDGDRPIRRAWIRDTIGELLESRHFHGSKSKRTTDLILRLSVAATIMIGLIQFQILRQRCADAEATITANIAPLGEPAVPLATTQKLAWEIPDRNQNEVPANQLAEADPPRAAERRPVNVRVPERSADPPRPAESPVAAVETAPIPKPSPTARLGFDLDHGTPMPPDSREAKPVY